MVLARIDVASGLDFFLTHFNFILTATVQRANESRNYWSAASRRAARRRRHRTLGLSPRSARPLLDALHSAVACARTCSHIHSSSSRSSSVVHYVGGRTESERGFGGPSVRRGK